MNLPRPARWIVLALFTVGIAACCPDETPVVPADSAAEAARTTALYDAAVALAARKALESDDTEGAMESVKDAEAVLAWAGTAYRLRTVAMTK